MMNIIFLFQGQREVGIKFMSPNAIFIFILNIKINNNSLHKKIEITKPTQGTKSRPSRDNGNKIMNNW
jgi:hypothetical protein